MHPSQTFCPNATLQACRIDARCARWRAIGATGACSTVQQIDDLTSSIWKQRLQKVKTCVKRIFQIETTRCQLLLEFRLPFSKTHWSDSLRRYVMLNPSLRQ